jgi:hypothetical protein
MTAVFLTGLTLSLVVLPAKTQAQTRRGGGVIRLEEMIIEGRVQKPNAFFISSRQPLVYEIMEIKESFLPDIVKAAEEGPF